MRTNLFALATLLTIVPPALAQKGNAYPARLAGAKEEAYKKVGDVELKLYIFNPEGLQAKDKRPAIVFFFGGGWMVGSPKQFETQCKHLASLGMVAIAADYRVASRHHVKAKDCVADAKSAIRWVRANANKLGIDPDRIVAGGGSAGGHLAAATGTLDDFDEPGEDAKISSRPNAMILFNPAVLLAPINGKFESEFAEKKLEPRLGVPGPELSPAHHVSPKTPPCIIFHGKADTVVPYPTVEEFVAIMKEKGVRCELVGYEGEKHGFFNAGRPKNAETVEKMDEFLKSLGYIKSSSLGPTKVRLQ